MNFKEAVAFTLKRFGRTVVPLQTRVTLRVCQVYIRSFGLMNGLLTYYRISNTKRGLIRISIPQSKSKIILRACTSDIPTFEQIFIGGEYDIETNLKPELIIDGGANIGCATIYFANRYPEAQIIAVEPEASNFEILRANTSAYPNITIRQSGIWNRKGFLKIENPEAEKWECRVEETESEDGHIEAITIDEILESTQAEFIDILKLDIEGAEKELFSAYEGWLGRVRILMIELHDRYKPGCSESFYSAVSHFDFEESRRGETVILVRDSLKVAGDFVYQQ